MFLFMLVLVPGTASEDATALASNVDPYLWLQLLPSAMLSAAQDRLSHMLCAMCTATFLMLVTSFATARTC